MFDIFYVSHPNEVSLMYHEFSNYCSPHGGVSLYHNTHKTRH